MKKTFVSFVATCTLSFAAFATPQTGTAPDVKGRMDLQTFNTHVAKSVAQLIQEGLKSGKVKPTTDSSGKVANNFETPIMDCKRNNDTGKVECQSDESDELSKFVASGLENLLQSEDLKEAPGAAGRHHVLHVITKNDCTIKGDKSEVTCLPTSK